jgi:hypothetical protein
VVIQGTSEADGSGETLQRPDRIEAGEPVTLTYRFTLDGEPVTDLRPYLPAPRGGGRSFGQFLHEHGMLPARPAAKEPITVCMVIRITT